MPEFSGKTGEKTVDGRLYDDVRGMGGEKFGRSILYAVGEETLVSIPGFPSPYGSGYVAAHEAGHVVEQFALTNSQRKRLQDAYDDRTRANGPWLSVYAKSNPHEVLRVVDRGVLWTSADQLGKRPRALHPGMAEEERRSHVWAAD